MILEVTAGLCSASWPVSPLPALEDFFIDVVVALTP